jgi:Tfp pilus assembly major pilin PilA
MINPDQIYQRLSEAGDDYADKDAAASLLEEIKKVLLSQIMQSHEGSVAAREMAALADDRYVKHITVMVEARKDANKAKTRWLSAQAWVDAKRTEAATERAALKRD